MGEFERVERLRALFERASPDVLTGIGDDCAVLAASELPRVWTVDTAVEGVHFARSFMTLEQIGYRAFMAAASDVAAMGARAVSALSSLILPSDFRDDELSALSTGLVRAADACACPIVGGNLSRGGELSLTTSVLGESGGRVVLRGGASAGEQVFVSGPLGGAALGLVALQRGLGGEARFEKAVEAFLRPRARLDLGPALPNVATSAIDVSDGLAQDLDHLARASGKTMRVELERVPVLPEFAALARALGLDPEALIASGGEDYEILFTARADQVPEEIGTPIGVVLEGEARAVITGAGGRELALHARGFDHFGPGEK